MRGMGKIGSMLGLSRKPKPYTPTPFEPATFEPTTFEPTPFEPTFEDSAEDLEWPLYNPQEYHKDGDFDEIEEHEAYFES